jgi:hypothetical protein
MFKRFIMVEFIQICLSGSTIVALLFAATFAAAQPACLPKSVFVKNGNRELPVIDLGYIHNVLSLCAYETALDYKADKLLGCWTVDSTRWAHPPQGPFQVGAGVPTHSFL